jgi:hypothetical protein
MIPATKSVHPTFQRAPIYSLTHSESSRATHSSLQAFPPRTSNSLLECSKALPQLFRFNILTISGFHVPVSFNRPSWSEPNTPKVDSVVASAIFFWTSWKDARGRLNCVRLNPYSLAREIQSSRLPMTPHEIPYLALFKHEKGPLRPCTCGNMLDLGILTLSMKMDPVKDARRASLFLIAGVSSPFVP